MDLLPAIDLRGGKVVRLRQGDDDRRTTYSDDPTAQVEAFAEAGAHWIHVVDLDAAFGEAPQRPLIEALAKEASDRGLKLELGGGLRDRESITWALGAGCTRVVVGSLLAKDFDTFQKLALELPQQIVPGLDFKHGQLAISGWKETAGLGVRDLGQLLRGLPCPAALVTDVARDGEMGGPNFELAQEVASATGIPALLSGGVHTLEDLRHAAAVPTIAGAVVGRALYDGSFTLEEALAACVG